MENTIINPDLVAQITTLVQAWDTADRRIREMLHGWEQRATRAGLECGFYLQLAKLPGADIIVGNDAIEMEEAGRIVYASYVRGHVHAALDTLTA